MAIRLSQKIQLRVKDLELIAETRAVYFGKLKGLKELETKGEEEDQSVFKDVRRKIPTLPLYYT